VTPAGKKGSNTEQPLIDAVVIEGFGRRRTGERSESSQHACAEQIPPAEQVSEKVLLDVTPEPAMA
jgi:hypothetical protein